MTYHARVAENGTMIQLPAELARELGLKPGDELTVEREGRNLLVRPGQANDAALMRLREALRGYSVDQFLAERGSDWDA